MPVSLRLIHGDCLVEMKNVPDCSVDCIVTDPPYRLTSSGTSGVASVNCDRQFIGIELDEKYFNIAKERICRIRKQKL